MADAAASVCESMGFVQNSGLLCKFKCVPLDYGITLARMSTYFDKFRFAHGQGLGIGYTAHRLGEGGGETGE